MRSILCRRSALASLAWRRPIAARQPSVILQNDRLIAGDDPPDENDIVFNRRASIALSAVNVILAVIILFMGALLSSREFSLQLR